ncbi:unnamed protein product [Musa acuminata subsp. burmannicoides]
MFWTIYETSKRLLRSVPKMDSKRRRRRRRRRRSIGCIRCGS